MKPNRKHVVALGLAGVLAAPIGGTLLGGGALPAHAAQDGASAVARMQTAEGQAAGEVEIIPGPNGVIIKAMLDALPAGEHGFHLHETGDCSGGAEGGFKAAGGHISADGGAHGFLNPEGPHAGDMPNVIVLGDGTATVQVFNDRVSLEGGEMPLLDEDGSAVIVHAKADTYGEEAGAGDRIACGVIEPRG